MSEKEAFTIEKIKEAANAGISFFQWMLGTFYRDGKGGLTQDDKMAAGWFCIAASNNHEISQHELAQCYLTGRGVERSVSKAVYWLGESAKLGYSPAQVQLGKMYLGGIEVEEDESKAFMYFKKAVEQEDENAYALLGYCYANGIGTEIDFEKAVENFRKGEKAGDAQAQYFLGFCYKHGYGVPKRPYLAVALWGKAADQCLDAQYELGLSYLTGEGIEPNVNEGIKLLRSAMQKGHDDAPYVLAKYYLFADRYAEGASLFEAFAKQGDAEMQRGLGICYEFGYGVVQNYNTAVYWYNQSTEQGDAEAECRLGLCYIHGKGTKQSDYLAAYHFESSAKKGYSKSQLMLGVLYCDGKGVAKNRSLGVQWLQKAYENGEEDAGRLLEQVAQIQAQEIERARAQANQRLLIEEYNKAVRQLEQSRARYLSAIQKKKKELERYAKQVDEYNAWVNDTNRKMQDGVRKLNNVGKYSKTYYNGY